ncbi:44956_t:CDS:2 [Gigaspora margarita]|uniref:44956_t:CDS:1 n=1 Tax=Gigaspora margarita TaxID=4874 RepID=A0ABN7UKM3_GIGMA|nr:44956_t:CDS:2 [Gigaspora margarita]
MILMCGSYLKTRAFYTWLLYGIERQSILKAYGQRPQMFTTYPYNNYNLSKTV